MACASRGDQPWEETHLSDITIYELRDPRTQETKYVGSTKQYSVDWVLRTQQSNATVKHARVNVWFRELSTLGLYPIGVLLETTSDPQAKRRRIAKLRHEGANLSLCPQPCKA
jgi:hypothetical protein